MAYLGDLDLTLPDPKAASTDILYVYVYWMGGDARQPYVDELLIRLKEVRLRLEHDFKYRLNPVEPQFQKPGEYGDHWLDDHFQQAWFELLQNKLDPPGPRDVDCNSDDLEITDETQFTNITKLFTRTVRNIALKSIRDNDAVPQHTKKQNKQKPVPIKDAWALYEKCSLGKDKVIKWFTKVFRRRKPHPFLLDAFEFFLATGNAREDECDRAKVSPERAVSVGLYLHRYRPRKRSLQAGRTVEIQRFCEEKLQEEIASLARQELPPDEEDILREQQLNHCLQLLKESDREIVNAYYCEGLTDRECAVRFDIRKNSGEFADDTARQRRVRAIDKLRDLMDHAARESSGKRVELIPVAKVVEPAKQRPVVQLCNKACCTPIIGATHTRRILRFDKPQRLVPAAHVVPQRYDFKQLGTDIFATLSTGRYVPAVKRKLAA